MIIDYLPNPAVIIGPAGIIDMVRISVVGGVALAEIKRNFARLMTSYQESHQRAYDHP